MRQMTRGAPLIELNEVSKSYRIYASPKARLKQALFGRFVKCYEPFEALKPLSLVIRRGETVGIIGRNGSGKSTLLQLICKTLSPSSGTIAVKGRVSALLELGAGFNPEFSGHENIFLNAAILGLSREETKAKYNEIVAFSGLSEAHISQPVKHYSSGMYVRLAFSVAISVEPEIVVIDEALAVGDEGFQRKCFARLQEMQARGVTILFVSHSAQSVVELCNRAILLDNGELLADAEPKSIVAAYHRLVYCAREQRDAIRAAIRAGRLNADEADSPKQAASGAPNPHRIEYGPDGGHISDYHLTDLHNQPLQVLCTGARYRFHYTATAEQPLERPRFGMLIKNRRGVEIGGGVASQLYDEAIALQPGETRQLCFEFDCPLLPGHYFLNCGFTCQQDGEEVFVHRILDAIGFKVAAGEVTPGIISAGQIDLNLTVSGCE